jgi:hypothetical protein
MSYQSQAQLTADVEFQQRTRSCMFEQASTYINSGDLRVKALADAILKSRPDVTLTFHNMVCATPGFADKVEDELGEGIEQARILDPEILASVQQLWGVVAGLYYNEDGTPIT